MADKEPIWFYDIKTVSPDVTIDELGSKGFNLSIMTTLGVNVPPAFVIPTSVCLAYQKDPQGVMDELKKNILPQIRMKLSGQLGYMPLVSVRSGAKVSMPGMMDTILNVGLDELNIEYWASKLGSDCAMDSFNRLVEMYGNVVNNIDRKLFENATDIGRVMAYKKVTGQDFPDATQQMIGAVEAVFKSWNNPRAVMYRDMNNIPHDMGTAVVIQSMVFGNFNDKSCTGVMFTRSPSTGENEIVGEFLVNAQGEDVVAGIKTPEPIVKMHTWNSDIADDLLDISYKLETHYKDMQDIEFTVQDDVLYLLQTRSGKRTAEATLKIALDMFDEELIDSPTLLKRVKMDHLLSYARPTIDPLFKEPPMSIGIGASNGIVSGVAVMTSLDAINCTQPCILVTDETTPDDIGGMNASLGILTRKGGATSHAAVVARGMNKVCVVGCTNLPHIMPGAVVTIDGSTGNVWMGKVPVIKNENTEYKNRLTKIVMDRYKVTKIVTHIDDVEETNCLFPLAHLDEGGNISDNYIKVISKMKSGIIDATSESNTFSTIDSQVAGMLGATTLTEQTPVYEFMCNFLMEVPSDLLKDKDIYIIGIMPTVSTEALRKHGYKIIPKINTIDDFIMADSGLVMSDPNQLKVSTKVLKKVASLKELAGESVKVFKISTGLEEDELLFDTLAGTAIHPNVLLQSVLN